MYVRIAMMTVHLLVTAAETDILMTMPMVMAIPLFAATPYCQSCYDDISDDFINEYSYKPDPIFHRCPDEKRIRYYGVELEIDDSYLYDYCNMFGISEEELMLLYEMGYDDEEIELMMMDNDMLRKCLAEAKEMVGIYT